MLLIKYNQLSREQRYAIYLGLEAKKKKTAIARQIECSISTVCREIKQTDNGLIFKEHKWLAKKLNTTVYFTDTYSSWEKGAIENTNMLYRQYIPKKLSFKLIPEEQLMLIQQKINDRPRKAINFQKPYKLFS